MDKLVEFNKLVSLLTTPNPAYYLSRTKKVVFTKKTQELNYDGLRYYIKKEVTGAGRRKPIMVY